MPKTESRGKARINPPRIKKSAIIGFGQETFVSQKQERLALSGKENYIIFFFDDQTTSYVHVRVLDSQLPDGPTAGGL